MAKTRDVVQSGESFVIENRRQVPAVAIGRFALPKNLFRANRHPLSVYQATLEEVNRGKGQIVAPHGLFLPYIGPDEMMSMVERVQGREVKSPRRQAYELRSAKRMIASAVQVAQQAEGQFHCEMLETLVHNGQELAPDEEILVSDERDDPGPFSLWGTVEVQFRSQPALVDDHTLGIRPYIDDELAGSYEKLKRVIQHDTPFDASWMDVNAWEPVIPVFRADQPIPEDLKAATPEQAIRFPRPPMFAGLQEIKVSELQ